MTDYFARELAPCLVRALSRLPVVVVSGLRQVGKSMLLLNEQAISTDHTYRTLDDFATLAAAQNSPESLLHGRVVLDEVQRCPELLLAIKRSVDEEPAWAAGVPGR